MSSEGCTEDAQFVWFGSNAVLGPHNLISRGVHAKNRRPEAPISFHGLWVYFFGSVVIFAAHDITLPPWRPLMTPSESR